MHRREAQTAANPLSASGIILPSIILPPSSRAQGKDRMMTGKMMAEQTSCGGSRRSRVVARARARRPAKCTPQGSAGTPACRLRFCAGPVPENGCRLFPNDGFYSSVPIPLSACLVLLRRAFRVSSPGGPSRSLAGKLGAGIFRLPGFENPPERSCRATGRPKQRDEVHYIILPP